LRAQDPKIDANYVKNRGSHVTVLVKNQAGLKELYKLITQSHTKDYFGSPKILKSELVKAKASGNLLFGSGCVNGEVFDQARTNLISHLEKTISFYDFIEIQPLAVYKHLLQNDTLTEEELI
jgi:DNA polymerase-3 subunit alpha (Gram-positive type)